MNHKPKIQYVGQFYVHGSEARAMELQERKKKAKTSLPQPRQEKVQAIYVDPVAVAGILVAVMMLAVMVMGAIQLHEDWLIYEKEARNVERLTAINVELAKNYRSGYDLEEIEEKALAMGLVPKSELKSVAIAVTVPAPEPVMTWDQKLVRFWHELWA